MTGITTNPGIAAARRDSENKRNEDIAMTEKRSATLSKGIGLQLNDLGFRDGIRGHSRRDLSLLGTDFSLPESAWYEYGFKAGSDIRSRCRM